MLLYLYIEGVLGGVSSICALKGSSVALLCSAQDPNVIKKWYKLENGDWKAISADVKQVTYNTSNKNHPTLSLTDLTKNDSGDYCCGNLTEQGGCISPSLKIHLTVTGKMSVTDDVYRNLSLYLFLFPAPSPQACRCKWFLPQKDRQQHWCVEPAVIWLKNQWSTSGTGTERFSIRTGLLGTKRWSLASKRLDTHVLSKITSTSEPPRSQWVSSTFSL